MTRASWVVRGESWEGTADSIEPCFHPRQNKDFLKMPQRCICGVFVSISAVFRTVRVVGGVLCRTRVFELGVVSRVPRERADECLVMFCEVAEQKDEYEVLYDKLFCRTSAGLVAEGRRRRLAESWKFSPREVFMALQSKSASPYSCLTAGEIYTWLTQQSFCTSVFTIDDVAEAILPFAEVYSELRYEGFLRMVLPSQATDEWLRDAIIRRGRFSSHVDEHSSCEVPVEVMCRLTHLFEHEIDTTRRLHAHRRNLLHRRSPTTSRR